MSPPVEIPIDAICWSPALKLFCAVGGDWTTDPQIPLALIETSPDGITWTKSTQRIEKTLSTVCWSPELSTFCAISTDATLSLTSTDGVAWTLSAPIPQTPVPNALMIGSQVCWSPELLTFCAANQGVTTQIMTSTNGLVWTVRSTGSIGCLSIAWSPELKMFCTVTSSLNSGPGPGPTGYTVTYNSNGSMGGSVPVDSTNYYSGQTVTVLGNTGTLLNNGYTFAGWNTMPNGTGTNYTQNQTFLMGSANVTLFARWTTNPTHTVTYSAPDATSGTVPTDLNTYAEGVTVTVLGNPGGLTKNGYTFSGWNQYYPAQTFLMPASDVTLSAVWLQTTLPPRWIAVASSADGTKLVAGMYDGNVWISDDSGGTWIERVISGEDPVTKNTIITGGGCQDVASTADGTIVVAAYGYWTSFDRGVTWIAPDFGWWSDQDQEISVCASANGFGNPDYPDKYQFVMADDLSGGCVRVYTPWQGAERHALTGHPTYWREVASSADGALVAAASPEGMWISIDRSPRDWKGSRHPDASWVQQDGQGWSSVAVSADGTKLFASKVGEGGSPTPGHIYAGILYYNSDTDWHITWNILSAGERVWQALAISDDGSRIAAVENSNIYNYYWGGSGDIYLSSDSGASWAKSTAGTRNWFDIASSADGMKLVAVDRDAGIWVSSDGGDTWSKTSAPDS